MSLFPKTSKRQVLELPVDEIRPNPHQPRRTFHQEELSELASSIAQVGVLQPLSVRRTADGWELIAGERRLRAAKLAGLARVPCLNVEADDGTSALLALVENLHRCDLHYLDEAAAIARLISTYAMSQEEAARRLGRSQSAVANKLRLLRLGPECTEVLRRFGLTERHARALLRLEGAEAQLAAARTMGEKQMNVAAAEEYVEGLLQKKQRQAPPRRPVYIIKDVRLFLNSVSRGMETIRRAGVDARCEQQEDEESITITIQIPKKQAKTRELL